MKYSFIISALLLIGCGDEGGNSAPTPVVVAPDTTNPVIGFEPSSIELPSMTRESVILTATDNEALASPPIVTCTLGVSFKDDIVRTPEVEATQMSTCTATVSDTSGNNSKAYLYVTIKPLDTADCPGC